MTENPIAETKRDSAQLAPDPSTSPFERQAIAGLPYEKGGEEDRAVRRVIEAARRERDQSGDS